MAKRKATRARRVKKGSAGTRRAVRSTGTAKRAARKAATKSARQSASKTRLTSARRARAGSAGKRAATRTSAAKKPAAPRKAAPRKAAAREGTGRTAARKVATSTAKTGPSRVRRPQRRPPTLDRARRTVAETEMVPMPPSSLDLDRSASAARSGGEELRDKLHEHTSTSPAMTAGDVDADWEAAESTGDEAPGGDNPTPDQDVVDDIGRALGVEYADDEELQGGDEIRARDKKRWELDPASSDDFDDRD